jgi:predicted anti-sigma-YlaC factor YlaD
MAMLDCKEVLANLSRHLDDEDSAPLRKAIEEHLARCGRCRVIFDTTKRMLKVVVHAEPFEVPLAVSARLYARLEKLLSEESGLLPE